MTVLIAKANEALIRKFKRGVVFQESTVYTSTFIISPLQFKMLAQTLKVNGYNPYALMSY